MREKGEYNFGKVKHEKQPMYAMYHSTSGWRFE